jgi:hypothetical protein
MASTFSIVSRAPGVDPLERLGGLPGQFGAGVRLPGAGLDADDRALRLALDRRNHLTDLAGRLRGPLGELAHFIGDDGKTTPLFTGARRFDGRVEGQQVGLIGNLANRLDDAADRFRTFAERADHRRRTGHRSGDLLHFGRRVAHDRHAFGRQRARRFRNAGGLARLLMHLIHVLGQRFHFARRRERGVALRSRPRGDATGVDDQLSRRLADLDRVEQRLADDGRETLHQPIESSRHGSDLVPAVDRCPADQIAIGVGPGDHLPQRRQAAAQMPLDAEGNPAGEEHQHAQSAEPAGHVAGEERR